MPHFVFLIDIREGYSTLFDIFINSYLLHSENPVTIEELATAQYKLVSQSLEIPISFK